VRTLPIVPRREEKSPIRDLFAAVDRLDLDAVMAMVGEDGRMLSVEGQRAEGRKEMTDLLAGFFGALRSTSHTITSEWHHGRDWIAEVEATYELRDHLCLKGLPRAVFIRMADDGISDLRIYGAHERPLPSPTGESVPVGARWVLPL
jgi:hypothetical protein